MKNKPFLLVIALIFSSFLASAGSYSLLKSGDDFTYSFYSNDSFVPFPNIDSMDICIRNLVETRKTEIIENISIDITETLPQNINSLDLDCYDQFLHRLLNYIIYYKENITLVYDENLAGINLNNVLNFASHLDIGVSSYQGYNGEGKAFYIGSFDALSEKAGYFPESHESVFYADEDNDYVAIVGRNTDETLNSLNILIKLYNEDFAGYDCVLLRGCGESVYNETIDILAVPEEQPPSNNLISVMRFFILKWKNGDIDIRKFLEIIKKLAKIN